MHYLVSNLTIRAKSSGQGGVGIKADIHPSGIEERARK